jgi:hypothetical protein
MRGFLRTASLAAIACLVAWSCLGTVRADAAPTASANQEQAAKKFVQEFYDWYVARLAKINSVRLSDVAIKEKKASFSPGLAQRLKEDDDAQDKVAGEIVGLDFDPFVNTNSDTFERYVVGKVTPKGGAYWVDVHYVYKGKKNPKPLLTPEVKLDKGRWIFVNFHYGKSEVPSNENLLSLLKALKDDRAKFSKATK